MYVSQNARKEFQEILYRHITLIAAENTKSNKINASMSANSCLNCYKTQVDKQFNRFLKRVWQERRKLKK